MCDRGEGSEKSKATLTDIVTTVFDGLEAAASRRPVLLLAPHLVEQLVLALVASGGLDGVAQEVADKVRQS